MDRHFVFDDRCTVSLEGLRGVIKEDTKKAFLIHFFYEHTSFGYGYLAIANGRAERDAMFDRIVNLVGV